MSFDIQHELGDVYLGVRIESLDYTVEILVFVLAIVIGYQSYIACGSTMQGYGCDLPRSFQKNKFYVLADFKLVGYVLEIFFFGILHRNDIRYVGTMRQQYIGNMCYPFVVSTYQDIEFHDFTLYLLQI